MKRWNIAMIIFSMGVFALADTVSFTAAEGYSAGELILNSGWTGSGGANFLVDPSGEGSVTNVGAVGWKNLSYPGGAQSVSGTAYTVSALFTVEGTETTSQTIDKGLYFVTFVDGAAKVQAMFRRMSDGTFDVGFYENSGSVDAGSNSANVSPSVLGLGSALSVSDQLRLSLTITRGADETGWTYDSRLENIDTSTTLCSASGTFESSLSFFTNDVVAGMSSGSAITEADLSPATVQEFSVLTIDPETVSFTSAEGYSEGELTLNSGWSGSGGANFFVNPFGSGSVTNVGAVGFKNLQYNAGVQSVSGTAYTVSSQFSFEGTDSSSQTVDKSLLMVTFVDGSSRIQGMFRRVVGGGFDVAFYETSGSASGGNSVDISAADLGLGAVSAVSDQLRLLLTITRGTDETDWGFSARLENLDTSTTLGTVSGTFESSAAFFTNDVTPGLSSASAVSEADLSPFTIEEYRVLTVDSDSVGFTSMEGYIAGELTDNDGWTGSAGSGFIVDPFGSGAVTNVGAVAFKNMQYVGGSQSVSGTSYTVSAQFSFEATDSSSQTINKGVYMVTFVDGSDKIQMLFRRRVGGDFDVAFFETSGSVNASQNGGAISPSLLGLGSTLSMSDQLRLTLTITRGADETDWGYSGLLENLDTSSELGSVSGTFESSVDFYAGDVVAGMSSASAAADADMSPLTISAFNVSSTPIEAPTVIITAIGTLEWIGEDLLKVTVDSNDQWENLKLVGSSDLVNGGWDYVAHSDDGSNAFVVTNLSYSTAVDSTHHSIVVQATNSAAFFGIE